ncbi:Late embryogenesis abundant (LEA) hydroxyproline-rich glycoprotein family [Forsythia ovata]|uniref:Late embryogenesis abundant (LEA) hydroxyproline-rich glycoprotein family n=1 Tax=Forsythia ovata TaxID=205694 RepID=A0ABD1QCY9_9LAMI
MKIGATDSSVYCWFFQVITVLSLASVVTWLSLIPRNPSFTIANMYFPSLNSKNSSVGNSSLILFDFKISNPNKGISIYYDGFFLSLYFKGVIVGTNSTPPFYQGRKNNTSWKISINAASVRHFHQGLRGGNIDFKVGVEAAVKFRIFRWKTKAHHIGYEAYLTSVKTSPNGSLSCGNDIKLHQMLKPGSRV